MTFGCANFLKKMQQVDDIEIFQVRGVRQNATATQCLRDWKALPVWFENRKMAVLFT